MFQMTKVVIFNDSMLWGRGFVQQAGVRCNCSHALRYHIYVNPEGADLEGALTLAYGLLFGHMVG